MSNITSITHPIEIAFRVLFGDKAFEHISEHCKNMGYNYQETLEYCEIVFEQGINYPATNDNKLPRRKPNNGHNL